MIFYNGELLKKSSNRKLMLFLSRLVTMWLSNIAIDLGLAANFGCNRLRINPDTYSKLIPSEVAVLFDSNLSRHHFLGQVVDLDLLRLFCTGFYS